MESSRSQHRRRPGDPRDTPVVLRKELLERGFDDFGIGQMVRDGELVRVRRGAYVDKAAHDLLDASGRHGLRARAVVKQAKTEVVLSHASALPEYDASTWHIDLDDVHVTRLDGKLGRHEAGVHQHCGRVVDGDVVERNGVLVMSATRVALEITMVAPAEPALCVVNDLLHRGHTTLERLAERYRSMDHWPRSLRTDLVLRLATPGSESIAESRCLYLFFRQGVPAPVLQYPVRDVDGEIIARLDFAWPDLGVWIEFDGESKYRAPGRGGAASDVVIAEKAREDLIRRLTGWRCIRLVWADLVHSERTGEMIRRALARAA